MKIADLDLGERPLFLAPMENVTDASFRFICKEFVQNDVHEFISSDGFDQRCQVYLAKMVIFDYE